MEHDTRRDARAAVRDELTPRELGLRLGPRRVERAGDPAGRIVDRVRLAPPPVRRTRVDEDERRVGETSRETGGVDRVVRTLARNELDRLDLLLAAAKRPAPRVDSADQDTAVGMPVMAEEPPEPLGAAHRPIGDDEGVRPDPRPPGGSREALRGRQRMAPRIWDGEIGKVLIDVEKRGAGDMPLEVQLAAPGGISELPAAVDELDPHGDDSTEGIAQRHTRGVQRAEECIAASGL